MKADRDCAIAVRTVDIAQRVDPIADVAGYRLTRVFVTDGGVLVGSVDIANARQPISAIRLREAIAGSLAARNLTPAAEGTSADCLVSYALGSRLAADNFGSTYEWGYAVPPPGYARYYGYYGGAGWGSPYTYREGRVTVDLYDARSHQALWHAYVDTDVTELKGAEADQRIKAAVAAIFDKFPIANGADISKS